VIVLNRVLILAAVVVMLTLNVTERFQNILITVFRSIESVVV